MNTTALITQAVGDALAAAPSPAPSGGAAEPVVKFNTDGLLDFFATMVVPPLLAVLGIIFLSKAHRGQVGKVLTSSGIAIVGLAFIAGAGTFFFAGESVLDLFIEK